MILNQWDQQLSTKDTDEFLHHLAQWHLEEARIASDPRDSQVTEIHSLISNNDISGIVGYDLRYEYCNPTSAYHLRQCLAFYQKRADIVLEGVDRQAVAVSKFRDSEQLCSETNEIFRLIASGGFCLPPDVNGILHTAQRKIARILGDLPEVSELKLRFGPGATTQVIKRQASARNKLSQRFACSKDFIPLLEGVLDEMQGWVFREGDPDSVQVPVDIVDGRLAFVPKNAKTDRGIVVEPMLNSMYQLGLGDHIANRLKRFGIDLTDQTKNQRLAREGSLTGELATLDLSSASDTIARLLVQDLLPFDWYNLITQISTSSVEFGGEVTTLEKISSMGNGTTFPLESLIFYALAWASCETDAERERVNVFGDDIIIPTNRFSTLTRVLHCVGFIPNIEKSFSEGSFRESCGKDYLKGIDIRPVYIKDRVTGSDAFVLHNYYVRTMQPEPAAIVLSIIDPSLRLFGPDGFGDGHLLGDYTPVRKKQHIKNGFGGHIFDTYTWKTRKSYRVLPGDRVLPSYTIYANPASAGLPDFDPELRIKVPGMLHGDDSHYDVCASSIFYRSSKKLAEKDRTKFGVTLPGVDGYKRISIYTLNPIAI